MATGGQCKLKGGAPRPYERSARVCAREDQAMKQQQTSMKTKIARIAALRSRSAYRMEKQALLSALADVRRRGEDPAEFLAKLEMDALRDELLGSGR